MNKEQQELIDEVYEKYSIIAGMSTQVITLTKEEFINKIKTDIEFSKKWGLQIEESQLSLVERFNIRYPGGKFSVFQENYPNTHKRNDPNGLLDAFDIPTKLITITYNNKTITSYE